MRTSKILILDVDGGTELASSVKGMLTEAAGFSVEARGFPLSLAEVARLRPNVIILCHTNHSLEETFDVVRKVSGKTPIVVVTASPRPQSIYELLRRGAADFLAPPIRWEELAPRLWRLLEHCGESETPAARLKEQLGLKQFVGESESLMREIRKISKIARSDCSVLIGGETGTGKEMIARAIHYLCPRNKHPFVPVNCGAIPADLAENELFGHKTGAYTGALSSVNGLAHEANGGTLFLDEVDSLSLITQVKLLRFLQTHEYRPLGESRARKADVRVLAASNVDLKEAVSQGRFRSDLFYRLNVVSLQLPALRERREDIPSLARHFIAKHTPEPGTPLKELSAGALEKLGQYEWPGNVRELENTIERALVLSEEGQILAEDIAIPVCSFVTEESSFKKLKAKAVANFESGYIRELLAANKGNISQAARAAKKNRRAFWQLMRKHNIALATGSTARL